MKRRTYQGFGSALLVSLAIDLAVNVPIIGINVMDAHNPMWFIILIVSLITVAGGVSSAMKREWSSILSGWSFAVTFAWAIVCSRGPMTTIDMGIWLYLLLSLYLSLLISFASSAIDAIRRLKENLR